MFNFTYDERLFLSDIRRAIAKDKKGRDVLLGLSIEETEFYVTCLRGRDRAMPEAHVRRFFGLHEKHESQRRKHSNGTLIAEHSLWP